MWFESHFVVSNIEFAVFAPNNLTSLFCAWWITTGLNVAIIFWRFNFSVCMWTYSFFVLCFETFLFSHLCTMFIKLRLTPKNEFSQTFLSLMFDILLAATDGLGIPKYPQTYRGQLGVLHHGEPRACCLPPLLYRSQAWTGAGPQAAPVWQNSSIQVYYVHFNIYCFFC